MIGAIAAYGLVATYFGLMFLAFGHALSDLSWSRRRVHVDVEDGVQPNPKPKKRTVGEKAAVAARNAVLVLFALVNFVVAWIHIYHYVMEEREKRPDLDFDEWFVQADLFVGAYRQVVETPAQWYWTSQLLLGVGTIVVFTFVESFRCGGIRPLSSFFLGCSAAISLAFPLLLGSVANTPK